MDQSSQPLSIPPTLDLESLAAVGDMQAVMEAPVAAQLTPEIEGSQAPGGMLVAEEGEGRSVPETPYSPIFKLWYPHSPPPQPEPEPEPSVASSIAKLTQVLIEDRRILRSALVALTNATASIHTSVIAGYQAPGDASRYQDFDARLALLSHSVEANEEAYAHEFTGIQQQFDTVYGKYAALSYEMKAMSRVLEDLRRTLPSTAASSAVVGAAPDGPPSLLSFPHGSLGSAEDCGQLGISSEASIVSFGPEQGDDITMGPKVEMSGE
ncbi:hypothetical protein C8Q76DRAFT_696972 [Earliella scabrosa]|nr:hypothetical protein C8Q76DRAFT_696972 [Earliella scabrosa]